MVGARSGGYGRFSDMDDEPSSRDPRPAVPNNQQQGEARKMGNGTGGRDWQEIGNADVLIPRDMEYPLGVVHFVGGQGVGIFPKNAYGTLLEALVDAGEAKKDFACAGRLI